MRIMITETLSKRMEWIQSERPFLTKTKNYEYSNDTDIVFFSNIKDFKDSKELMYFEISPPTKKKDKNSWRMMLVSASLKYSSDETWEYVFVARGLRKRSITLTASGKRNIKVGEWYTLSMCQSERG